MHITHIVYTREELSSIKDLRSPARVDKELSGYIFFNNHIWINFQEHSYDSDKNI